jgi:branched-chain amino acid transport system permease protein
VEAAQVPEERSVAPARQLPRPGRGTLVRAAVITVGFVLLMTVLPGMISIYWIDIMTSVWIYSIVALGLNLLFGRVGMVSLGQIAVLALGAWVAARLSFATSWPFPVILLAAGLITGLLGVAIGLPALRVGGLYLALITLMLSGAITVALSSTNFPNGGGGFLGYSGSSFGNPNIRRPGGATSDPAFYRYALVVLALLFLLALLHVRSKPGRAWAAIRQSEPAALAAGVNMNVYKLWAFGLAAFCTGVAGGLLGADVGKLYTYNFTPQASITLLAVVLMGGIFSLWGALVAGLLSQLLPALLDSWGLPPDLLTVLFGIGVLQVLVTAPEGIVVQLPRDLANLGRLIRRLFTGGARAPGAS